MLLIDAIASVTGAQIAMKGDDTFIYLDGGKKVEKKHITAAQSMVADYESESKKAELRAHRDFALSRTDFLLQRNTEENALGLTPTIGHDDMQALLIYRQDLRDLPQQPHWPEVELPECPIEVK